MAWIHEEKWNLFLYPISYILHKPKFDSYNRELGAWLKHEDLRKSKILGWTCELCGSKSTPKDLYLSTLIQRVKWHINGRCKVYDEIKFYSPRELVERIKVNKQ